MKSRMIWLAVVGLLLCAFGCNEGKRDTASADFGEKKTGTKWQGKGSAEREAGNAVYYWKSSFDLSAADSLFIAEHDVKRLYVRFFDVVEDYSYGAVPSATVKFWQKTSEDLEIVPTVFITLEALQAMEDHEMELADRIRTRLLAMIEGEEIENVWEVQVDCDWTAKTEKSFFALCKELREMLRGDSLRLSSTIRLHQLARKAPPVDSGVLMLYNTGSVKDPKTKNSILSFDVVKQYLRDGDYALPLDFAYPAFSWGVVFENDKFKRLTRMPDFSANSAEATWWKRERDNCYRIVEDTWELDVEKGELVRYECAEFSEIMRAKQLVEKFYGGKPHTNIIYHLDERELEKYSKKEIDNIYE